MASTEKVNNAYVISVIGEGTVFRGDLELQGVLHINGDFYGKISTVGDVAIGITGRAQCQICARNLVVSGTLQGQVVANGSVHLNSSAVVVGDLETVNLTVDPRAIVRGKMKARSIQRLEALPQASSRNAAAGVFDAWRK